MHSLQVKFVNVNQAIGTAWGNERRFRVSCQTHNSFIEFPLMSDATFDLLYYSVSTHVPNFNRPIVTASDDVKATVGKEDTACACCLEITCRMSVRQYFGKFACVEVKDRYLARFVSWCDKGQVRMAIDFVGLTKDWCNRESTNYLRLDWIKED